MSTDPDAQNQLTMELPANYLALQALEGSVRSMLEQAGPLDEKERLIYQIWLAVHETCMNIIDHAYAGQEGKIQAKLTLLSQPRQLVVDLYDTGLSFNPAEVPEPDLSMAQTSGYGLFLIHQLMDDVLYEAKPGNNHWRLSKSLST